MRQSRPKIFALALLAGIFSLFGGYLPAQGASAGLNQVLSIPSSNFSSPANIIVGGDHVWIANQGNKRITKIDRFTGSVLGNTAAFSDTPNKLAWDGTNLWVSFTAGGKFAKVDQNLNTTVSGTICPGGIFNDSIAAANGRVFVTCWNPAAVAELNPSTLVTTQSATSFGGNPFGLRVNTTNLYIDIGSGVRIFSVSSLATAPVAVSTGMPTNSLHQMTLDNDFFWMVGNNNGQTAKLGRLRLSDNAVTLYTVSNVTGAGFNPIASDGRFVYLPNSSESAFASFDITAGTWQVEVANTTPTGVATTPGEVWSILGGAVIKYSTNVQSVTWNPSNVSNALAASPITPSSQATSSGAGAISYSVAVSGTAQCTVNSSTGVVTAAAVGSCTVRAVAAATVNASAGFTDVVFTFSAQSQAVTWSPTNTSVAVGLATLTPNALATSSGPGAISYAVQSTGGTGCQVNAASAALTFSNMGTCIVRATAAAGGGFGLGSTDVSFTITASQQTVTWAPTNTSNTLAASPVTPNAAATSSGAGAISYQVSNPGNSGCTVNSSTGVVSATSLGFCVVRATAAAAGSLPAAFTDVTFYFRSNQTVTWSPTNLSNPVGIASPNAIAATDGTGMISYSVQNAGTTGCTVNATPSILATSSGLCVIRATAAATNTNFAGTVDVTFTFTSSQTVTWNASNTGVLLAASPLTPNALATSNGPGAISYAVQSAGTTGCSVNPSTAVVTATSQGLCVIRATAAASTYHSAGFVDKTFTFSVNQTVTWTPITTILITGAPIVPSSQAISSGPGAISYWVDPFSTNTACTVNGSTGAITVSNVGNCTIIANSAAGNGYNLGQTSVTFTVTKVQTVTWSPANTDLRIGWSPFSGTAAATTDGTGSRSYAVQSAGTTGCTINSATRVISFTAIGECVIRATAAASGNWLSGFVDVSFRIVDIQSVSWIGATVTQSSGTYTPSQPVATGGGILDYSVVSAGTTGCTVNPSTGVITFSAIGQCQVRAEARANGFYLAGASSQMNFNFYANQTVTWAPTNITNSFSGGTITPNAAASTTGGGAITYSLVFANAACSLNTSTGAISSSSRTRCFVRANAAATGYFNGASSNPVTFTFTGPQTVTWLATNTTNPITRSVTPSALAVSSGGTPITYSVALAGTAGCSVNTATGVTTASAIGTCSIRANAAAALTFESAFSDLTFIFVEGQIISWPATNTTNPDSIATLTPNALASSNLGSAITYSVQSAGTTGCTVNSATAVITVASAGVCVVRATAAASGSVVSDYRDFSFTFDPPSISVNSVASNGLSLYLTHWNPRLVLLGAQPTVSIFGFGFTSDATVTLAGKTFAPKTVTSSELTFELPKLSAGTHSFVVEFGNQGTITFVNAVQVTANEPIVMGTVASKSANGNRTLLRAEHTLAKLVRSVAMPVKLVCTAYMNSNSTAKDRMTTMNATKRMCQQTALRVGAKMSTTQLSFTSKVSSMIRKVTLALSPMGQ